MCKHKLGSNLCILLVYWVRLQVFALLCMIPADRLMMEDPWQMDIPDPDACQPCKNKEAWLPEVDDQQDRRGIQIKYCIFGGECKHNNFADAACWSFESPTKCLKYLMQHGTHSGKHLLSNEDAYKMMVDNWGAIEWAEMVDTFEDRERYRQRLKDIAIQKEKGKRRKIEAQVEASDSVSNVGSAANITKEDLAMAVTAGVQAAMSAGGAASASSDMWSGIGSPAQGVAGMPLLTEGTPGPLQLNLGDTVTIPREKLKIIQDNLQRSEHAISGALQTMVESAKKLASERAIIQNTINTVARFTGEPPNHF